MCLNRWRDHDKKPHGCFRSKRHVAMSWKQSCHTLVHTEKQGVHQWFWHSSRADHSYSVQEQNHDKPSGPQHGNEKRLSVRRRIIRVHCVRTQSISKINQNQSHSYRYDTRPSFGLMCMRIYMCLSVGERVFVLETYCWLRARDVFIDVVSHSF